MVSQPKLRAWARRSGIMSPTITTAAPRRWQAAAQADSGFALLTVPAASAGNVEGNRNEIAEFDEFDVASGFNDLARDFVAKDETFRSGCAASDHVLIAAADVGGDNFQNDSVLAFSIA